jgi:hypothetical protein
MYKDLDTHEEQCFFKIVNCKNEWGAILERQDLDAHYQVCKLEPIECVYHEFGCNEEIIRENYNQHLEEFSYEHSLMFVEGQKKK